MGGVLSTLAHVFSVKEEGLRRAMPWRSRFSPFPFFSYMLLPLRTGRQRVSRSSAGLRFEARPFQLSSRCQHLSQGGEIPALRQMWAPTGGGGI